MIKDKMKRLLLTFTLNNQEIISQKKISVNIYNKNISQRKLITSFYNSFNKYFNDKLNNFSYMEYIDQRELFEKFVYLNNYKELFLDIFNGKIYSARIGIPYLSDLVINASRVSKNYIFMPYKYYDNIKRTITFIVKFLLNIVSLFRLIFLKIIRPKDKYTIVHTSNNFHKNKKYDYRMSYLIEELDNQKIKTCFFIRTKHYFPKIIINYLKRGRLSFYSDNIITLSSLLLSLKDIFSKSSYKTNLPKNEFDNFSLEIIFKDHLKRVRLIKINNYFFSILYKTLNANFFIGDNGERAIMEFLSAKYNSLQTIYFQHGTEFSFSMINKFIKNSNAPNLNFLSHDILYAWNEYWKDYYIKNSNVYKNNNVKVGGYFRNIENSQKYIIKNEIIPKKKSILFLIEMLTPIQEIIPFVKSLIDEGFSIVFKLRPQQKDAGDNQYQLLRNELKKMNLLNKNIDSTDDRFEDLDLSIYECAVGSYTTALMDCLNGGLDIFFIDTLTWSDCFNLSADINTKNFYCESPKKLINQINNLEKIRTYRDFLEKQFLPNKNKNFLRDFAIQIKNFS